VSWASNRLHLSGWYCFWRQTAVTCLGGIVCGVKRPSPVLVVLCMASNGRHLSGWYCVWRQTAVTCLGGIVYGVKRPSSVWVVLCMASNGHHNNVYSVSCSVSAYMDSVIKYVTLKMLYNYEHNK